MDPIQNNDLKPPAQNTAEDYFWAANELKKTQPKSKWGYFWAILIFVLILLCVSVSLFRGPRQWVNDLLSKHVEDPGTRLLLVLGLPILLIVVAGYILFPILRGLGSFAKGRCICPRCQKNFTLCPPEYCHCCGEALVNQKCDKCSVNWGMSRIFANTSQMAGNSAPILYCPGCGVYLDSEHRRVGLDGSEML